jgi:hypothetical protein
MPLMSATWRKLEEGRQHERADDGGLFGSARQILLRHEHDASDPGVSKAAAPPGSAAPDAAPLTRPSRRATRHQIVCILDAWPSAETLMSAIPTHRAHHLRDRSSRRTGVSGPTRPGFLSRPKTDRATLDVEAMDPREPLNHSLPARNPQINSR